MIGLVLKGRRIDLRPKKITEAENYLVWFQDSKVTKFLGNQNIYKKISKERDFIKRVRKSKTKIPWSIYCKEGNVHIGSTSLGHINKDDKKAEWGIVIGRKEFWGQGIADEVAKLLLDYAFKKLKLNRVELLVHAEHKGAIRCYRRCGFKKEGTKRKATFKNGKYHDEVIMSILKEDYKNLIK